MKNQNISPFHSPWSLQDTVLQYISHMHMHYTFPILAITSMGLSYYLIFGANLRNMAYSVYTVYIYIKLYMDVLYIYIYITISANRKNKLQGSHSSSSHSKSHSPLWDLQAFSFNQPLIFGWLMLHMDKIKTCKYHGFWLLTVTNYNYNICTV